MTLEGVAGTMEQDPAARVREPCVSAILARRDGRATKGWPAGASQSHTEPPRRSVARSHSIGWTKAPMLAPLGDPTAWSLQVQFFVVPLAAWLVVLSMHLLTRSVASRNYLVALRAAANPEAIPEPSRLGPKEVFDWRPMFVATSASIVPYLLQMNRVGDRWPLAIGSGYSARRPHNAGHSYLLLG